MTVVAFSSIELPNLYINGFAITVASNTTLSIGAGICRDSTNSNDMSVGVNNVNANGQYVAAPLVLNAATNGVNGLDVGTFAASKFYAIYLIGDSLGYKQTACTLTLASNSAPGLPQGYDQYRLIGYAVTDASIHFLPAYISGTGSSRLFTYDAVQATSVTAGTSTSYAAIVLTTLVPPVTNTPVVVYTNFTANAAADTLKLQGYASTGDGVSLIAPVAGATAHTTTYNIVLAQLNSAAPTINYKVSAGAVAVSISGFYFTL